MAKQDNKHDAGHVVEAQQCDEYAGVQRIQCQQAQALGQMGQTRQSGRQVLRQLGIRKGIQDRDEVAQAVAIFDQQGAEGQGCAQVGDDTGVVAVKRWFDGRNAGVDRHVQSIPWPRRR